MPRIEQIFRVMMTIMLIATFALLVGLVTGVVPFKAFVLGIGGLICLATLIGLWGN